MLLVDIGPFIYYRPAQTYDVVRVTLQIYQMDRGAEAGDRYE